MPGFANNPAPLPPTQMPPGVLCMMLIATLQFSWTLFVGPIRGAHGWGLVDILWAFTIFIATEAWITPFAGYAVDYMGPRRGPRLMILLGV
ncbi:MAG TPA: hypothetical protein VHX39_20005 [Acetobacteraceae bacterium]|nr:hypothetical protein [Acetobacteraceae bacterium]